MAISSIGATSAATAVDQQKVFREADFMKIMLAELSQQDPFEPQETSKIVEGMQKLQDLANSRFEKFRDDQRWAQDLVGKTVTAQEMILTDGEARALVERGLAPGRGYASVNGTVDAFRVHNETVYVEIEGKHYAIDNVRQVQPGGHDTRYLAELAQGLIGRRAGFIDDDGTKVEGLVTGIENDAGAIKLSISGRKIDFERIIRIGAAS